MRLTLEQDYSIRIAYELCRAEKYLDVGELADLTGISRLYVQKIMHTLGKSRFFVSKKGADGGYKLAEGITPADISFYDILNAAGDGIEINACLAGKYTCTRPEVVENGGRCEIQKLMRYLNGEWTALLRSATFEKVIGKHENTD